MSEVAEWSPTAASNVDLAKEGATYIRDLNNIIRELQAAIARFRNDLPWVEYGRLVGKGSFAGLSGNQISFNGPDARDTYRAGRQIRIEDPAQERTYYGKIKTSTYTNGGNNVLTIEGLGSGVTLPVTDGLRVWLYVVDPQYVPSIAGGASSELVLTADGKTKLRVDGSGLEFWFSDKLVFTAASDGLLIGKKSRGDRNVGMFLGTDGTAQLVANSDAPLFIAREVANGGTQAVRFITVIQNGVEQKGGLNSTGKGNLAWYNGEPPT